MMPAGGVTMEVRDYPILYVDDDHANRVVMKHNLAAEFALLIAESGAEALEILARQPVAVLLTDQRMPVMSGVELAERVRQLYPDTIRVIITAYSDLEATVEAINRAQVARFIKKPWTREELLAVMRESLQSHHNALLLRRLQEKLSQLDRLTTLGVMGSSIAHDLRQPLTSVVQNVEVLGRDLHTVLELPMPISVRDRVLDLLGLVGDLHAAVERLTLITESMFTTLRDRTPQSSQLDVRRVVEAAAALTRGQAIPRACLEVDLPDTAVPVMAAEGHLIQLLVNLILNAVQAMPPGLAMSHRIRVRLRRSDDRAVLSVEDNGKGIAPDHLSQIFVPFFTTKGADGTGLGLAICKQIVDDIRGTIEVQSVLGRGTTFTVTLPLV
jgi:two-component system, NtrC family, sensor kinase